jgi:hypothetical protein
VAFQLAKKAKRGSLFPVCEPCVHALGWKISPFRFFLLHDVGYIYTKNLEKACEAAEMVDFFHAELQTLIPLVRVRGKWIEGVDVGIAGAEFTLTIGQHLVYEKFSVLAGKFVYVCRINVIGEDNRHDISPHAIWRVIKRKTVLARGRVSVGRESANYHSTFGPRPCAT